MNIQITNSPLAKEEEMTEDEKDFKEWWNQQDEMWKKAYCPDYYMIRHGWHEGRRTLREKERKDGTL